MPPTKPTNPNLEQTMLMPALGAAAEKKPGKKGAAVALVSGSSIDYSGETSQLLTERLRLSSLILSAGFAAFLAKGLFLPTQRTANQEWIMLPLLAGVTAITGFLALRIQARCEKTLRNLRLVEMLIFGSPAILFTVVGYCSLVYGAQRGYLPPITVPWLILIFTYALFIPNTWQRALVMILPPALAPAGTILFAWATSPDVSELMKSSGDFHFVILEAAMVMAFGATIAVWGVKTINVLRSKAFEAKKLGQYRLKRLLGKGGMGEVYLAEHLMLKRPCAIKLIRPEIAGDPDTLARFEREVQSTAKLTHWNTVEIFDYGRADDGTFYYVMEYLPGMSLDQLVERHGPMPAGRVISLLAQTCSALAEAHSQNMIHRDLKPGNIFAAKLGGVYDVAKLLDFGLVRTENSEVDVRLTQAGMVTGSPLYLSPEQATGDNIDARSDIYSLGCVAYFLLTGQPPFVEDKAIKLILAHAQRTPALPSSIVPGIPSDLESVVMHCLEKDPRNRYQSISALRRALLSCASADEWSSEVAHDWWNVYGCPKKRELDECVIEGRELLDSKEFSAAGDLISV
ncbi:serine/threonine-protein kinase [Planctomicrobium sp. SH664]|uniref:serine/threonine-protein kinase n=1 Tax=Planctomicrobium sp. SH664 TaxID=3448125 RepID=UPI003F5CA82C